jgi:6-phosphofructokinase 2
MEKVVSLTLNPALDVATSIHSVAPEIKLRCAAPGFHPGGGGINVSRAIRHLGGESSAVYTAGGHNGAMLTRLLNEENIDNHPIEIDGVTRENVVVYEESTGLQYRFTMPGPAMNADEWISCLETLFNLEPAYIVASGSLPAGVPAEIYGEITRYAREYGIRVILDTDGDALNRALGKGVFLLKPNLRELERYAGETLPGEGKIGAAGQRLIAEGLAEVMLVSLGAAGAALITGADCVFLRAPIVPIRSKVGAGDSMVGGVALGLAQGMELTDAARLAVAAGSAAVMTAGTELCRKEDAWRLYDEVAAS